MTRPRFRFGLRTALVGVTVLACLAALAKAYPGSAAAAAIVVIMLAMWMASDLFQWVSRR